MVKTQCNLYIDVDVLDRFRKISRLTPKFEISETIEGWMQQYIRRYDEKHAPGKPKELPSKMDILCPCGAEYGDILHECPSCGRLNQ